MPYTPELNPIEMIWEKIREKFFKNKLFKTLDTVTDELFDSLIYLINNKNIVKSITGGIGYYRQFQRLISMITIFT